jgi:hypothetical protein
VREELRLRAVMAKAVQQVRARRREARTAESQRKHGL